MDKSTPAFQKYLDLNIRPLSETILQAIEKSPFAHEAFISIDEVAALLRPGYVEVENGYTLLKDGSATISVLTDMPGVTPAMWHWWFGWHGDRSEKYKLWHPLAHMSAEWKDQVVDQFGYIGRDSKVREYIGPTQESVLIQFKNPAVLGLPEFDPKTSESLFIVARIGLLDVPVDFGWLIHQVRKTEHGSEMRSRFWLGGSHFSGRNRFSQLLIPIVRRLRKVPESQVIDLLKHCSEEMGHLAQFLPDLHTDFQS